MIQIGRIPAMGSRVQIGQFFNGHTREILTAYPRLFDDEEFEEKDPGSSYKVFRIFHLFFFTEKNIVFCSSNCKRKRILYKKQ